MPSQPSYTKGYLTALASAAVLSTTAVLIRYLTQTYDLPALVLAFWRDFFLAAGLFLGLRLLAPAQLHSGPHWKYLLIYGGVLAIFNAFWTLSVALNGAAVATVLAYSSAAFTALLGRWLLQEALYPAKGLAIILSLTGCVLVANALNLEAWRLNPVGILTGLGSGLLWAVYSLMGRSASRRGLNPWTTLLYTFAFATVFLLAFNLTLGSILPGAAQSLQDLFWLGQAWSGWAILLFLSIGPTLAGFGLYNVALTMLPSSVTNLIATSEPVWTAFIAYAFLGERLTGLQILGSILVLGGVALLRLYEAQAERRRLDAKA